MDRRLFVVAALIAASLLASQLLPGGGLPQLRYDRAALASGEWWRWLTAHLVHLDLRHALLNASAAAILAFLLGSALRPIEWCAIVIASIAAIDAGLWFGTPEVEWYAGASGFLHGVIAAGGIALARVRDWRGPVMLVLVGAKLLYEKLTSGSLGFSGDLPVVLDAHLYGAIGGVLGLALVLLINGSLLNRQRID